MYVTNVVDTHKDGIIIITATKEQGAQRGGEKKTSFKHSGFGDDQNSAKHTTQSEPQNKKAEFWF